MQLLEELSILHSELFFWWHQAGRVLPWREKDLPEFSHSPATDVSEKTDSLVVRDQAFQRYMTHELRRDPYRVVVAELMLQQTQVDRVLPKYEAWMGRWPTIQDLGQAELAEVLIFWQGLGYNRRARFLWLLGIEIGQKRAGVWPKTEEELLKLPGIGKYTARAILSFAFGEHVAVVDTNVKRVLRRILDGKEAAAEPLLTEMEWFAWADQVLPVGQADPWNQLIMDFGALVCSAKAPQCEVCPVQKICQAQQRAELQNLKTYRDLLKAELALAKTTAKKSDSKSRSKDSGKRFEDTDRFFRGRILDQLRAGAKSQEQLWQILNMEFGLLDQTRFETLLTNLKTEQLISQKGEQISLG